VAKLPELLQRRSNKGVLTVIGAVYGGVNLSWRRLGGVYVMEAFLIVLAVIAGTGVAFLSSHVGRSTITIPAIMIAATLGKRSDVQVLLVR